jgi:peptidoglycan-associated lipoprotein
MLTAVGEQSDRRMAELRREEEAAIEAGLRDAFFGFDLWSISNETMMGLSANADWIKRNPRALVRVSGHCDERGTNDYNVVLGEKRAKAVQRVLSDLGVNPKQVSIISFGKNRPFCSGHDESCYQQNRRGHFFLSMK